MTDQILLESEQCIGPSVALPVCLFENSNRLVSLWDMQPFLAYDFVKAASIIGQMYSAIQNGHQPRSEGWTQVISHLRVLEIACAELGLKTASAQILRVKEQFDQLAVSSAAAVAHITTDSMSRDILEIQIRIEDELKARRLFILSYDAESYFDDHQFPSVVSARFPDAEFDMKEAAKCFALERPTACLFHLMRLTEYGVQDMARLVGISDQRPN